MLDIMQSKQTQCMFYSCNSFLFPAGHAKCPGGTALLLFFPCSSFLTSSTCDTLRQLWEQRSESLSAVEQKRINSLDHKTKICQCILCCKLPLPTGEPSPRAEADCIIKKMIQLREKYQKAEIVNRCLMGNSTEGSQLFNPEQKWPELFSFYPMGRQFLVWFQHCTENTEV